VRGKIGGIQEEAWRGSFERRNPMEKIKEGTLDAETIQATNNLTTL